MKKFSALFLLLLASCVTTPSKIEEATLVEKPTLTEKRANYLYHFAYDCITQEYPNKLGQVLGDASYLKEPSELHPAFYGCFDWHSSVHGHWTLLTLCKELPNFEHRDSIFSKLTKTITKENIEKEVAYFDDVHNKTFERTYGWAWLLKVAEVLRDWNTEESMQLYAHLEPLVTLLEQKYIDFLTILEYPIRVGEHANTAFGMSFALDYASKYSPELAAVIKEKARLYFVNDKGCPLTWEPGGFDFLSPCLQEAALLLKVLPKEEYIFWLNQFLPGFIDAPENFLEIASVVDRSDGKLAHLDGLNFSRAWCLFEIGNALENEKMIKLAIQHFNYSYEKMDSGEYAGAHWLASFALYALQSS